MPWTRIAQSFPTDGSFKSLVEWSVKSLVIMISTFGVNQLKSISESTAKLNQSIAEIKTEVSVLSKKIVHLEHVKKR